MISVIMGIKANKNRLEQVARAVTSILNQVTPVNVEFIICDNGSDNFIKQYLDDIAKVNNSMIIVRDEKSVTLPQKLNLCLKSAKGNYVARMDDDDYSYPERLSKQYEFLEKYNNFAFVGSNIIELDFDNFKRNKCFVEFPEIEDFKMTQPYIHPSLMFRKECLIDVNGYSESKWCVNCDDYDLLLRLYKKGYKGANIQKPLLEYSIINSQLKRKPFKYRINEVVIRYKRFKDFNKQIIWFPFVIKPIIVGLLPLKILNYLKAKRYK